MSRVRIIKKNDEYTSEYQVGDIFQITGTWYGGVHIVGKSGIPVSLDREEYMELDTEPEPEEEETVRRDIREGAVSYTHLAKEIGLCAAEGARLYCLPSVSAYIGADIVAGAYVCQLQKESGNVLFIDIGTNGEIVLSSHGRLLCCSCAAGPALEGMNISSGTVSYTHLLTLPFL